MPDTFTLPPIYLETLLQIYKLNNATKDATMRAILDNCQLKENQLSAALIILKTDGLIVKDLSGPVPTYKLVEEVYRQMNLKESTIRFDSRNL